MIISTRQELIDWLFKFGSEWAFRGQTSDWELEPNINRILPSGFPNARAVDQESRLLSYFRSSAMHYAEREQIPNTDFAWTSLLQHYGGPTRLLDLTQFPMVGLFFAFDGATIDDNKSVIYAFNYREINKRSLEIKKDSTPNFEWNIDKFKKHPDEAFAELILKDTSDTVWIAEPNYRNLRILRQGGSFIIKGNISRKTQDILNEKYNPEWVEKIEIPHTMLTEVTDILGKCGLGYQGIYPGLEGLAKDVKSQLMQSARKAAASAASKISASN